MTNKIGEKIRRYRYDNRLSQSDLAKKMKCSQQAISDWEKGVKRPSLDRLIKLSGLLEISLDQLVKV